MLDPVRPAGARATGFLALRLGSQLLVVAVGVLLALWADAWVSARAERSVEAARLGALLQNVDVTLRELEGMRGEAEGVRLALESLLVGPNPDRLPDPDSVRRWLIQGFLGVAEFEPHLNVYQDLKSSGELALLEDPAVRESLSAMDAALEHLAEVRSDLATVQQLNFDPYLIRRVDLAAVLFPPSLQTDSPGPSSTVGDDLDVLAEREFRNLAAFKMDLLDGLGRAAARLEEALLAVKAAAEVRILEL